MAHSENAYGTVNAVIIDTSGTNVNATLIDGKPRVSAMPYTYDIGERNIPNHVPWSKIGYAPTSLAEFDIWSYASNQGTIAFPSGGLQMEVISNNNVSDIGTVLMSGTASGGSLTLVTDAAKSFAISGVAVGDCICLDGTVNDYGYITAVSTTTIIVGEGFAHGSACASGVNYRIVDYSATSGAQVLQIEYLDNSYIPKYELVAVNGSAPVYTTTSSILRVNSLRVAAAGAGLKTAGNVSLRAVTDTPVYSFIAQGYTRARNIAYTVPASHTLYVTTINAAFGHSTNKNEYCRVYTRATQMPGTLIHTNGIFYPYTEAVLSNSTQTIELDVPTKLSAQTDIKVSAIASVAGGVASVALRGWLEE
jgi:hypothetical protein